jgi:hypothetical protein
MKDDTNDDQQIHKKKKGSMIVKSKKEETTLFYDRVVSIARITSSGRSNEKVLKGGEEAGFLKLRIQQSAPGEVAYVIGHCNNQRVLDAEVSKPPSGVLDDGETIKLWLFDTSARSFQRLFIVTFFDENSAAEFFDVFSSVLPQKYTGKSFYDMRDEEDNKNTARGHISSDDDDVDYDYDDDYDDKSEEDEGGDTNLEADSLNHVDECTTTSVDEVSALPLDIQALELDGNFGESQDLYNPFLRL